MKNTIQKKTGNSFMKTVFAGILAMFWMSFLTTEMVIEWLGYFVKDALVMDIIKLGLVYLSLPLFMLITRDKTAEETNTVSISYVLLLGIGTMFMLIPALSVSFHEWLSNKIESELFVSLIRLWLSASVGVLMFVCLSKFETSKKDGPISQVKL